MQELTAKRVHVNRRIDEKSPIPNVAPRPRRRHQDAPGGCPRRGRSQTSDESNSAVVTSDHDGDDKRYRSSLAGTQALTKCRQRVQQQTLGHRGWKNDRSTATASCSCSAQSASTKPATTTLGSVA